MEGFGNSLDTRKLKRRNFKNFSVFRMKRHWVILLIISLIISFCWKPIDHRKVLEIMRQDGYIGESHNITTEDGYILTIHRINGAENSVPVLLVPGLTCNSAIWFMLGAEKSLPYLLSKRGYDVWLANVRGNDYATSHVNLTTDDSDFWEFTFHEMAVYDIPAMVEYISNINNNSLIYIGHSQGTQTGFIMASERPEIAKKFRLMIHFAPIAFLSNIKGVLKFVYPLAYLIQRVRSFIPIYSFARSTQVIDSVLSTHSYLSRFILLSLLGFEGEQLDPEVWEVLSAGSRTGTSIKNLIHYSHNIGSGKFGQFDYGEIENIKIYNQTSTPEYNLTEVNVPNFFYCAKEDWLGPFAHAKQIYQLLPKKVGFHTIDYDDFSHADFVWAKDAKELVYDHVINLMDSYKDP